MHCCQRTTKPQPHLKGEGFPYSIRSVGLGADPSVQAVSLQVTLSHPPGGRLPLLSARPGVTFPATEHHRPFANTKLFCLVTEAHRYEQLCSIASSRLEPTTYCNSNALPIMPLRQNHSDTIEKSIRNGQILPFYTEVFII